MASDSSRRDEVLLRLAQPAILLAVLWAVQLLDAILPGSFTGLGVRAWSLDGLPGIVAAPFLHSGWPHLIANSVPLLVLGGFTALDGVSRFWAVAAIAGVASGAGAWLVNAPGTVTVGASGLVFGFFGYLVMRAFVVTGAGHRILYLLIAVGIVIGYGGMILGGVFRAGDGVSWQAHLFGAVGGGLAAWLTRPRDVAQGGPRRA